jgi:CRISPR/Cas system CSM-associated protein Csm5 (group 7 of RAMP superfamily)
MALWQNIIYSFLITTFNTMPIKAPFTNQYYTLEILTPMHIGDSKEKEYVQGQDYYYDNAKKCFCFFNKQAFQKLLKNDLDKYVSAIILNKPEIYNQIVQKICADNPSIITRTIPSSLQKETIQKVYSNGFGVATVPGSSIKGALRSIFGVHIKTALRLHDFNEKDIFGSIDKNFMRLVQVGDVALNLPTQIFGSKIFSGDIVGQFTPNYTGEGKWKDAGGHNIKFNAKGFETFYETYAVGATGILRINFGDGLMQLPNKPEIKNSNMLNAFSNNAWLTIAKQHTENYLLKEKAFFSKFENADFANVLTHIDELININKQADTVLLRLGAGSGYHAITGDWQTNDHISKQGQDRNRQTNNTLANKTRKVSFDATNKILPGFVKITITSLEQIAVLQETQKQLAIENQKALANQQATDAENALLAEAARLEALKPKMVEVDIAKLKKGVQIDGEVTGQDGAFILFKPFVQGYETQKLKLRYPAGMPLGKAIIANVKLEGKNLIATGAPILKS